MLAARRGTTRAAEIGTGAGVGAAWIASALPPGVPLFTSEVDPELAARAAELFADDPDVTVLAGSWRETLPAEAPFDLVFVDGSDAKDDVNAVVGILAPGGTAVLDDFWHDPRIAGRAARLLASTPASGDDRGVGDTRASGSRGRSEVTPSGDGNRCR